jgi:hypothetical protein
MRIVSLVVVALLLSSCGVTDPQGTNVAPLSCSYPTLADANLCAGGWEFDAHPVCEQPCGPQEDRSCWVYDGMTRQGILERYVYEPRSLCGPFDVLCHIQAGGIVTGGMDLDCQKEGEAAAEEHKKLFEKDVEKNKVRLLEAWHRPETKMKARSACGPSSGTDTNATLS